MSKIISDQENLQVLYEDNHIIVVNKRVGDIVQGDKTGDTPLSEVVKAYLKKKYDKPGEVYLGVVHRLDRPTTGVVMFSKTSKALSRLNKILRDNQAKKIYWAVVKKAPVDDKDTLVHWLKKNPKNNKSTAYESERSDCKKAVLHYKLIQSFDNYHLLEIELESGRHHQIRCQLARIGSVIKGDLKYGADRSNKDGGIHLHAKSLGFVHPVKNVDILIEAPLPEDPIWDDCKL